MHNNALPKITYIIYTTHWKGLIILDSVVGIATGCGLDGRGVGVRVQVGQDFSPLHVIHTRSGAHPASYPMGSGGSFPEVKRPGREADHSPPTSAEVKNMWIYTSISHMLSWRSA
jgi:hypothetical protein